ncbi:MAG: glycosyltransferase family 2 protein [Phycisphaerae bacterium]|nr:glycosyltransferase family 2 protein [Phycisphaerae bacterium]
MATVDIVIPLYNKQTTIERAIESIIKQTYQDWHLIIVDDGSTDNSFQVAKQFTDPRITFIQQENRGPGAARNEGLNKASSEYIAFLDADDQWYPGYLENGLKAIRNSDVSFVGTFYEEWPEQIDMAGYWEERGLRPGVYELDRRTPLRNALYKIFFFHVGNTLVRTKIAKQYGGFYEENRCLLGEDTVFFARLVLNEPFSIIEPVAVRHNRQDSNLSNIADRPIDIFLQKPRIILDYCSEEKKNYARQVLVWHAWNTAHFRARAGRKADALYLKEHFPEMKRLGFRYIRLCFEIHLSRWFPYWIKFKCLLAALIKKLLRKN